jgi:hypothetical protein
MCLCLVLGSGWPPAAPARAQAPASDRAFIVLAPGADANAVAHAFREAGGHVTHAFPPAALIGQMPAGAFLPAGILAVHRRPLDQAALAKLRPEARRAAGVWNALLEPAPVRAATEVPDGAELVGDALIPPPPAELRALSGDLAPNYFQTSEYFIGRVAVGIVLPESDGSADPSGEDWTPDERALVLAEITAALDWWAACEPAARLTFVYDDGTAAPVPTSYEPITRPYRDQALWITETMTRMGYTGLSYFDQVRAYNNALRDAYDTDWVFTIFVVDSSADADNRFADGYFAYAYLGGPFAVMTYGNNGYGAQNMEAVAAHEIGHVFLAMDQYPTAYQPCSRRSGYLDVENQNSQYGACASNVSSIMRGQISPYSTGAVDDYARGQLGWRDSDGDGILDPVDTQLSLVSGEYRVDAGQPGVLTFTGSVRDTPYPSPSQGGIIINTVETVQYRIGAGEWLDVQPDDGAFDSYAESFTFSTPPLPEEPFTLELRAGDTAGNELFGASVIDPADMLLNTTLHRQEQQSDPDQPAGRGIYRGQGLSLTSYVAGFYYRLDAGPWQALPAEDGAFDEAQEEFSFVIDMAGIDPGLHEVQVYALDGEGRVEDSPASDAFFVAGGPRYLFLPIIGAEP